MRVSINRLKPTQTDISRAMLKRVREGVVRGDKFDPVKVIDDKIVDGHHRVEGFRQAGRKSVEIKEATGEEIMKAIRKRTRVAKGGSVAKERGTDYLSRYRQ